MMNKEDGKKIVDEKTIAREIFGEPSAHGDIDTYGEGRTDNYSYAQPASTYEERKKQFWELDYETKRKVLIGLGIYFIAIAFILIPLPPVLIKYHLVSTALNPLWIGLFLANLAGAIAYLWVTDEYPYETIKEIGSGVFLVYIILSLFFFLFTVPLMYSSSIAG